MTFVTIYAVREDIHISYAGPDLAEAMAAVEEIIADGGDQEEAEPNPVTGATLLLRVSLDEIRAEVHRI
jgi:hypothetical protein